MMCQLLKKILESRNPKTNVKSIGTFHLEKEIGIEDIMNIIFSIVSWIKLTYFES